MSPHWLEPKMQSKQTPGASLQSYLFLVTKLSFGKTVVPSVFLTFRVICSWRPLSYWTSNAFTFMGCFFTFVNNFYVNQDDISRLPIYMSTIYTNQYTNLTFAHHLSLCSSMVRTSHRRSEGYGFDSLQGLRKFFWENILRACVLTT